MVYGTTATGSVSLSVSGSNVPGGTISVPVVLKTDTVVSGVDITVSYPSDLVDFVSSSDPVSRNTSVVGNTIRYINPNLDIQANSAYTVVTLTFKLKDGTTGKSGNFSVTKADVTDHLNGENTFYPSRGSASITVVAPKSTNANLASLTVNTGALSPAFSAGQTSYSVTVPNNVGSITIGATAADGKATVSGAGTKNLNVGANKFSVVVTAENGAAKTYTITVTRQAAQTATPVESPKPVTSSKPATSKPATSSQSSEPVSSEEAVSSGASSVESMESQVESEETTSSELVSSQPEEQPEERPDYTWMTPHILYIGGMLICLALGAAFGFFIRGRRG